MCAMFSIMLPGLMSPKLGFLLALAFLALFRSAWKWQIVKWSSRDKSGKIGDEINLFAWRTRNICITAVLTKISIFVEIFFFLFILFSRMRSIIFFFLNFSINSNFSKRIKIVFYEETIWYIINRILLSRKMSYLWKTDQSKRIIESSFWISSLINLNLNFTSL